MTLVALDAFDQGGDELVPPLELHLNPTPAFPHLVPGLHQLVVDQDDDPPGHHHCYTEGLDNHLIRERAAVCTAN